MTEEEAINIAARKARQLNLPWGPHATAKRFRLWPFAGSWRVVCVVPNEFSQSTIVVNARTGEAVPVRVLVSKKFGPGGDER